MTTMERSPFACSATHPVMHIVDVKRAAGVVRVPSTESNQPAIYFHSLLRIPVNGRCYQLSREIRLQVYREDGLWVAENEYLNLHAFGYRLTEALDMVYERFDVIYQRVVNAKDETLTPKMQSVRNLMREIVASVIS